jgi:hypothetical protein
VEEVQREVEVENGGRFATSEAKAKIKRVWMQMDIQSKAKK